VTAVPIEDYVLGSTLAEISPVQESDATVTRLFHIPAPS
jgi:hypothetical protein